MGEAKLEMSEKFIRREETLDLMSFRRVGIQYLDRWRPKSAEALERFWLLFDVYSYRKIMFRDETLNSRIGVYLDIQPGATASHRSGAEIQQQMFPFKP